MKQMMKRTHRYFSDEEWLERGAGVVDMDHVMYVRTNDDILAMVKFMGRAVKDKAMMRSMFGNFQEEDEYEE